MNSISKVGLVVLAVMVGLFMGYRDAAASAAQCTALGGTLIDLPGTVEHCHIDSNVGNKSGVFELDDADLHIHETGLMTVPAGQSLTINVNTGTFTMEVGAVISGNATTATGIGANITINVAGDIFLHGNLSNGAKITANQNAGSCVGGHAGNVTLTTDANFTTEAGSIISTNGSPCPAGEIKITAAIAVDIDGQVLSESTMSGVGAKQPPGGGPITITAGCGLTCNDHCKISSSGRDPGADLVRLLANCDILIIGLVQSTSTAGHVVPNSPPNHCATGNYSGKPANSVACIEIVAGRNLRIDSPAGQVNADTGQNQSWIDIFVRNDIDIVSDFAAGTKYRVHADRTGQNGVGGFVTVESIEGRIATLGRAISANDLPSGGNGGSVNIQAAKDVLLSTGPVPSSIQARGSAGNGGQQSGGTIFVRSWNGQVFGTAGSPANGELNAGAKVIAGVAGTVSLQGCTPPPNLGVDYTGKIFTDSPTVPIPLADNPLHFLAFSCGGNPPLPAYIDFVNNFVCACGCACINIFTPTSVKVGDPLTLFGTGLSFVSEVRFSPVANKCDPASGTAVPPPPFLSQTDGKLELTVPGSTGTFNIIAICPTGSYCTSGTVTITP
jgi:hypothetical protein